MEEHNRTDTMEVSDDNGSKNENTKDIAWWVKELDLRITDKETILEKGAWLNDAIINASMKVLRNQFPLVKGLQNCLSIPTRCDTNGKRTWNYDTRKHFTL